MSRLQVMEMRYLKRVEGVTKIELEMLKSDKN